MNNQWLSIQSFLQDQELLEAINTLSIHTKLNLAGDPDEERIEKVNKAETTIQEFLKYFDAIIKQSDTEDYKPIMGVNHRLRQLVDAFISARHDSIRFQSQLFTGSPANVLSLLKSHNETDKQALVKCLGELRILIEEHVHIDTTQVLGEF
jgi:hypothetical protein